MNVDKLKQAAFVIEAVRRNGSNATDVKQINKMLTGCPHYKKKRSSKRSHDRLVHHDAEP
jgi:hypothetical protein